MDDHSKICEILKPLCFLIKDDSEWGGYIDVKNKKAVHLCKSDAQDCIIRGTPEEERAKANSGLIPFHSHNIQTIKENYTVSSIPSPSINDVLAAYLTQSNEYVITEKGIWEVEPLKKLSIEQLSQINAKAWIESDKLESIHGDPAYWFWVSILNKELPAKKTVICDCEKE